MSGFDPFLPLADLGRALRRGETSARDLAATYLDRIARFDGELGSFSEVYRERALAIAEAQDRLIAAGVDLGPLQGLPIAVKDLLHWRGTVCGAGSKVLEGVVSGETSTLVDRLLRAGMVVLGKTQLVEFAFGGWGTNAAYGAPKNPWDRTVARVPGGSSSGSGVAVAAALAPSAIGTDTGGSIRIPAAFCGIVGLKPSATRVDRRGCVPLSTTLDSIGPMTRTVEDARLIFEALVEGPFEPEKGPIGRVLAVLPDDQLPSSMSPQIAAWYAEMQRRLVDAGWRIETMALPVAPEALAAASGDIIASEAYAWHRETVERSPEKYGPFTRQRLLHGATVAAERYLFRLAERAARIAAFEEAMRPYAALFTPTIGFTAIPLAEVDETRVPMSALTRPINYLDGCGLSLPAGLDAAGLPIGLQLVAPNGCERRLLDVGGEIERLLAFDRRPTGFD